MQHRGHVTALLNGKGAQLFCIKGNSREPVPADAQIAVLNVDCTHYYWISEVGSRSISLASSEPVWKGEAFVSAQIFFLLCNLPEAPDYSTLFKD